MDEATWNECVEPQMMLEFLRDNRQLSERKTRLLAVAMARHCWHLLTDERNQKAVLISEMYADGAATLEELHQASTETAAAAWEAEQRWVGATKEGLEEVEAEIREGVSVESLVVAIVHPNSYMVGDAAGLAAWGNQHGRHTHLFRDIFSYPPRRKPLDAWLAGNSGTEVKLATAAYNEREMPSGHLITERLAVLADALEEVGCSDPEILGHLRSPGPHYRGCHVVDLLLGKT